MLMRKILKVLKDKAYQKLSLDLKSTIELIRTISHLLIAIFYINKDVSLFEVTNIMDVIS